MANQGYKDESLLQLATRREETLLTLDNDFPSIHAQWLSAGKSHCGVFYGNTSKYQHTGAIGILVNFCTDWAHLIGTDDEALQEFVYNEIQYIQE